MAEVEPRGDLGPPPEGVRLETAGGTTRIVFETGAPALWRHALWWVAPPLIFGAIVYRFDPWTGYLAAGLTVLIMWTVMGGSKRARDREEVEDPAICLSAERIWIERPRPALGVRTEGAALSGAGAPGAPGESLPLDSIPRRAVRFVRVEETAFDPRLDAPPRARLVVGAAAGRLEYAVTLAERPKVEWAGEYLLGELARDEEA